MINAKIGNNVTRNSYILDANMTLKAALTEAGMDYSVGMTTLDGATIPAGGLEKTFADYGVTGEAGHDSCFLLQVVKADNA